MNRKWQIVVLLFNWICICIRNTVGMRYNNWTSLFVCGYWLILLFFCRVEAVHLPQANNDIEMEASFDLEEDIQEGPEANNDFEAGGGMNVCRVIQYDSDCENTERIPPPMDGEGAPRPLGLQLQTDLGHGAQCWGALGGPTVNAERRTPPGDGEAAGDGEAVPSAEPTSWSPQMDLGPKRQRRSNCQVRLFSSVSDPDPHGSRR